MTVGRAKFANLLDAQLKKRALFSADGPHSSLVAPRRSKEDVALELHAEEELNETYRPKVSKRSAEIVEAKRVAGRTVYEVLYDKQKEYEHKLEEKRRVKLEHEKETCRTEAGRACRGCGAGRQQPGA